MCIEDVAISRLTQERVTTVAPGTPVVLKANPDRLAVRVCYDGSAAGRVELQALDETTGTFFDVLSIWIAVTDTGGLPFGNASDYISYLNDGRLSTRTLQVVATGAICTVVETIALPSLAKIIARRIKEIQDAYPSSSPTQPSPAESVY